MKQSHSEKIERALEARARRRRYKRKPKMKVSGRHVFNLQKQLKRKS